VVRPWPASVRYPGWIMLPYLVGADVVNTALSAFLAFCDRPVYRYYLEQPNLFHIDPLTDQIVGAVIMWVVGSIVFLVPAVFVTVRLLQQDAGRRV
jgi:putative membrane protein